MKDDECKRFTPKMKVMTVQVYIAFFGFLIGYVIAKMG